MRNVIQITEHYGLIADDVQYTLYELHTIDPTKAPGYKADENAEAPPTRTEWRSAQRYYPLNAAGLSSAIQAAVIREVNGKTAAPTLAELLAEYNSELSRIGSAVTEALAVRFKPVSNGDLDG